MMSHSRRVCILLAGVAVEGSVRYAFSASMRVV